MKKMIQIRKLFICLLVCSMCVPFFACRQNTTHEPESTTQNTMDAGDSESENHSEPVTDAATEGDSKESSVETETDTGEPSANPDDYINLMSGGKFRYSLIAAEDTYGSVFGLHLQQYLADHGIRIRNPKRVGSGDRESYEIYIGRADGFPEDAMTGIQLDKLGLNGFAIQVYGNNILLCASNDNGLMLACEHMRDHFLDLDGGNTFIPKDYFYVSSNGLYLTEFLLADKAISEYTLTCDEGMEEPATYIAELVYEKCGVRLGSNEEGKKQIRLTADGAAEGEISARFENGDLLIRAADASAMKKAVVCFWFENIATATSTFALDSNFSYTRDLTQTVFYSDFNVTQSENVCCMDELITVHNYANEHGYKVFADYGAKYYISSTGKTVPIKTDVEWGNAEITIDDSVVDVNGRGNWIFTVQSDYTGYTIDNLQTIRRDMTNLGITLPQKSIVTFYDSNTMHYIRKGENANSGSVKTDSIVVDTDGSIDMDAPIMWNFDTITSIHVLPLDETKITVSGGIFTTVANQAPREYTYYSRGIRITRSNVDIRNIRHEIIGEGDSGAPYAGFLSLANCAYVHVENCLLSTHKTYTLLQNTSNSMGSYDIHMAYTISVTFKGCGELTGITDETRWGITGTDYCKNSIYDGCAFSRVDAHRGVANATIRNSVIGRWGAHLTGYGTLLIENSVFFTDHIVSLRGDYGSPWEGDVIIKNCRISPSTMTQDVYLITGVNDGTHNFGYDCYMPIHVEIDGLRIDTRGKTYVMADLNPSCHSEDYTPEYNYFVTERITVKDFISNSDEDILLSPNMILFADTEFVIE